jgi:5S rRNA maturation endonuclease (ribonuclease M5)
LDCGIKEAVKFLTGSETNLDMDALKISALQYKMSKIKGGEEEEKEEVKGLNVIGKDIENRYMSELAYRFFIHPPGKKHPTNILPETVDRYWVFERTWGYYSNRIIIPFALGGELKGFCALDILGKDMWLDKHPLKEEDDYRKVLYPMNFVSGSYLFGYDDCQKGADFIVVTEGPREVMKLLQEGFPNSVAILGSFLSNNQLEMLTGLSPKRIVLMFDGDSAGVKTTDRIADKLKRNFGDSVQKCFVPTDRDPKNLCREDFERLILG